MSLVVSVFASGCALHHRRTSGVPHVENPRDPAHPSCRTRTRLLAPAARKVTLATFGESALGSAIVWNERTGERGTLRFLSVDNTGIPRAPSAEIVDRAAELGSLSIEREGDGHFVYWMEGALSFKRSIDAQGRPRGDVSSQAPGGAGAMPVSACTLMNGAVHCKTSRGTDVLLPADAKVLSERLGPAGDLVLAQDALGLHLYALDCAAR